EECSSTCSRLSYFLPLFLFKSFFLSLSSQILKCLSSQVGWHDWTALNHSDRFVNYKVYFSSVCSYNPKI
ncbi:unnamed protein product, partial [Brassica napus]